jgi:hypothetical protein
LKRKMNSSDGKQPGQQRARRQLPVFSCPRCSPIARSRSSGRRDNGHIVAGCIANRSRAQVVGFSNFFAIDSDRDRYRNEAVTLVSDFAKGNPVVGYDRGAELIGLQALGFHSVGSLRVWLRS